MRFFILNFTEILNNNSIFGSKIKPKFKVNFPFLKIKNQFGALIHRS